jgi:hypothetical protein
MPQASQLISALIPPQLLLLLEAFSNISGVDSEVCQEKSNGTYYDGSPSRGQP